jgi:hypothetical protein
MKHIANKTKKKRSLKEEAEMENIKKKFREDVIKWNLTMDKLDDFMKKYENGH